MLRVVNRIGSASSTVGYVVLGAALVAGRALHGAVQNAVVSVQQKPPRRHALRIIEGQIDGAAPFSNFGGMTHTITVDPTLPHFEARLAHEFGHLLLAIARDAPAHELPGWPTNPAEQVKSTMVHVEECAAWALAQAITRDSIWSPEVLAHREHALRQYWVPRRFRKPTIPPPTSLLVQWLAQVTPCTS